MTTLLLGQLRRWHTSTPHGILVEGDLITIIRISIDDKGNESVTYISRHGRGETPVDIIRAFSDAVE